MFLNARRLRTQGVIAVTLASCSLIACDDPVASTDLRPEGAPEVLSVLVMNDPSDLFLETATFCKANDVKRPGFVGTPLGGIVVCDDVDLSAGAEPVADAVPTDLAQGGSGTGGWYIRVMFDELLDPDVEELIPIEDENGIPTGQSTGSLATTQPVTVTCDGVEVAYDGYYSPSGNNVTWPVGPSLVIAPTTREAIPTSANCTVAIKDLVVDKDNNSVPGDQRGDGGEYAFSIAPLEFVDSDPSPGATPPVIVPEAPAAFLFNAFVDPASLATSEIVILEHAMDDCSDAGTAVTEPVVIDGGDGVITVGLTVTGLPNLAWKENTAYSLTFTDDNAIADLAAGPGKMPGAADYTLCFNTDMAAP